MLDYSRFARYWLPAKATNRQPKTKYQQPTTNHYLFLFIDILFHKTTHDQIPTTDNRTFIY